MQYLIILQYQSVATRWLFVIEMNTEDLRGMHCLLIACYVW